MVRYEEDVRNGKEVMKVRGEEKSKRKKNREKSRDLKGEKILKALTLSDHTLAQIHTKTLSPINR